MFAALVTEQGESMEIDASRTPTTPPAAPVDELAVATSDAERAGFSGVVRVDIDGRIVHESAHGLADRAHRIVNTCSTRFAAASCTKGFTALVVMRLVELGQISMATTARSLLADQLPLIADEVTVEHLLAHRSGIGDYLGETATDPIDEYTMTEPAHVVASPSAVLDLLDGRPMTSAVGERFAYNDGGYALLALLAERASGLSYYDLVEELVCRPADLDATDVSRTDELGGDTAVGYVYRTGLRTNVLHVPVRGMGDGGVYTTVGDIARFWTALFDARIVRADTLTRMTTPHGRTAGGSPYGLGFWLDPETDAVELQGYDPGISFRSVHQQSRSLTWTVVSNWSDGAWPVADQVIRILGTSTA